MHFRKKYNYVEKVNDHYIIEWFETSSAFDIPLYKFDTKKTKT